MNSSEIQFTLIVLTRSIFGMIGSDALFWRYISSEKMRDSWTILRKLMRLLSSRSGKAVFKRMRSFKWTPLFQTQTHFMHAL